MSDKVQKLIEEIKSISVLELAELVKALEEEFGVSAAAPVAVAAVAAPAAGGAAAAEEDEKTEFDVVLTSAGAEKLKVVKAVRELTGLALKEAKDLVDNAPGTIKEAATKEEAANMKAKIEEVGGSVEIK
ncbi:MAG: 50S ribosomal protein L7/L12 [Eubacteriaceae bacterium]|jgi:large subunit ribosomal protein L7/L12|nr:50S ribosomal protein L7/L12 [Eubacteriaceae bacterium]